MPTNAADPTQLTGFSLALDGPTAGASGALEAVAWALARYRTDCADLPLDTAAPSLAGDSITVTRKVIDGTRRVASAFVLADTDATAHGTRVVDDEALARTLAAVATAAGGTIEVDHGVITDHEGSWSLGPDGLTGTLVGSIVVGAQAAGSKTFDLGPVRTKHEIEATVGFQAEGETSVTIGPDGLAADLGGEAFIGGKLTNRNEAELGPVAVENEVTVATGLGVEADVGLDVGWDEIELDVSVLAVVGLGGGYSTNVSVSPSGVYDWTEDRVGDVIDVATNPGDAIDDLFGGDDFDLGLFVEHLREETTAQEPG